MRVKIMVNQGKSKGKFDYCMVDEPLKAVGFTVSRDRMV